MNAIRVVGHVDEEHRLTATVPGAVPAGQVDVVLIVPEGVADVTEQLWGASVAAEWHDDLADARQDIYSLADGMPVDETG